MTAKRIRVLIVDDSSTARAALRFALAENARIEIVGEAADGATATRLVREVAPDLVTMDVFLRAENGLDVAASIMKTKATPIVVVTASDPRDPGIVFRAMQAGVLEVCAKLPAPTHPDYATRRARLVRTLHTLASVPVVHRLSDASPRRAASSSDASARRIGPAAPAAARPPPAADVPTRARVHPADASAAMTGSASVLLLGASTGGPPVLAALLRALPKPFPLPIALVQHMTPGFVHSFATWLGNDTGHPVAIVDSARTLENGRVYVPLDEHHLVLEPGRRIASSTGPARGFHRPSIDVLFESALAPAYAPRAIAVLLTGMGQDGARGLLALAGAGACTIAQAPSTCAVASMPSRAIELGAAELVLDPGAIPAAILARATRA